MTRTPIEGASDHGISEAIYLPDPDGNGIERLATDRPREAWPTLETLGRPNPLDLYGLLATLGDAEPVRHAAPGTIVGHVHLHVNDIAAGRRFYEDVVGFAPMTVMPNAVFVSVAGYHHHLGFNTWRGVGIPGAPAPETVAVQGERPARRARVVLILGALSAFGPLSIDTGADGRAMALTVTP